MKRLFTPAPAPQQEELLSLERSTTPTTAMNLLLRFETTNGPRTVIACSVPLQTAREVADAMRRAGHEADFVDRCASLSVADRVVMKKLQQLRTSNQESRAVLASDTARRGTRKRLAEDDPVHIAAE